MKNNANKISQMAAYKSTEDDSGILIKGGSVEAESDSVSTNEPVATSRSDLAADKAIDVNKSKAAKDSDDLLNDVEKEATERRATGASAVNNDTVSPNVRTVAGVSVVDASTEKLDMPVPETKKDKFFRIMDTFGDMVFLNIAFAVSCVPIITIGAAFTALYSQTLKMVKKEEGKVLPDYFKAFKKNLIPGTKAWILVLLYLYLIYVEYAYMKVVDENIYKVLLIAIGIELLILSFTLPLLFPLIARYENKTLRYFKNSLVLSLNRPGIWIRVYISWLGPALITLLEPKVLYYGWYAWVFILCSLFAYSSSLIIRPYFDELEAKQAGQ
ncbi:MAG: YesL family protein [Lachnospiraceae bacterium]|nr:YesL family protein [Lachnospiraceae bacterium]